MTDVIEGVFASGLSLPVVILGFFVLVFTGRLIPKGTVATLLAAKDQTIERLTKDADNWKTAYELEREARQESTAQTGTLLEHAKTTEHLIRAIQTKAVEARDAEQ